MRIVSLLILFLLLVSGVWYSYSLGYGAALGSPVSVAPTVKPQGSLSCDPHYPYVKETLVISNDTIVPGNYVPTTTAGASAEWILFDPLNGLIYVSLYNSTVLAINGSDQKIVEHYTVGTHPTMMSLNEKDNLLYVYDSSGCYLSIINLTQGKVVGTTSGVGMPVVGIGSSSENGYTYVSAYCCAHAKSKVVVFNGTTQIGTICGAGGGQVLCDPNNHYVYSIEFTGALAVINGTSLVGTIGGLCGACADAFDVSNGYIFVSEPYSNNIAVINTSSSSIVANIHAYNPHRMTYDQANGYLFVMNQSSGEIYVVNVTTDKVVDAIAGGPVACENTITFDPYNGYVYEASSSGVITIIAGPNYAVMFKESGLPAKSFWTLELNNSTSASTSSDSLYLYIPNGSYYYHALSSVSGYLPNRASGTLSVSGSAVTVLIVFSKVFQATFLRSGLPSGSTWYVNISGVTRSGPITGSSFSIDLSNGTYFYSVSTSNKEYSPSEHTGYLVVNGSPRSMIVSFTQVLFMVTFNAFNLPPGKVWYVNLSNGASSGPIVEPTYSFYLPNGSYTFQIGNLPGFKANLSGGSVNVTGKDVSVNLEFLPDSGNSKIFPLYFYEITAALVLVAAVVAAVVLRRRREK
ncbi:YncE family protein [Caldiplasma sukawensis]